MLKQILLILSAFVLQGYCQTPTFQWNTGCKLPSDALTVDYFLLSPDPLVNPGSVRFVLQGSSSKDIKGVLPAVVNIMRTISGLTLLVKCTIIDGIGYGSCTYNDLCANVLNDIAHFNSTNCPPELLPSGIDCKCPFNFPKNSVDIDFTYTIGDLSTTSVSFFSSGIFDVQLKILQGTLTGPQFGCINMKFASRKA